MQVALNILKNENDIDVVIGDYHMPLMDGLEIIEKSGYYSWIEHLEGVHNLIVEFVGIEFKRMDYEN